MGGWLGDPDVYYPGSSLLGKVSKYNPKSWDVLLHIAVCRMSQSSWDIKSLGSFDNEDDEVNEPERITIIYLM